VTASTIAAGATHITEAIANYGTAGLLPVMKVDMEQALRLPYPKEERGVRSQDGYLYDYPAYCLTTGDSLRWFRDEFGYQESQVEARDGISAYAQFDKLAEQAPAGCEGLIFLPHMLGQRSPDFRPEASGAFIGLRRSHTRAHFFRSLLEAWGYTIRYGLESYYPQGHPLQHLIATGGGARSSLWRQIVTDITGIPQDYAPDAEGAIADAYMAGIALGWFDNFDILLDQWIGRREVILPNREMGEKYQKPYERFMQLHQVLEPIFETKNR
jgi:xylulokinase